MRVESVEIGRHGAVIHLGWILNKELPRDHLLVLLQNPLRVRPIGDVGAHPYIREVTLSTSTTTEIPLFLVQI